MKCVDRVESAKTAAVVTAQPCGVSLGYIVPALGSRNSPKCQVDLCVRVIVSMHGKQVFEQSFQGKDAFGSHVPGACEYGGVVADLLNEALGEAVNQAVPAIAPLLNETGQPAATPSPQR